MGLFDNKNKAGDISMTLEITAGKENLNMGFLSSKVKMSQNADRIVYFDSIPDQYFRFTDYTWDGPSYKMVTTSKESGKSKGKNKEKTKRKGGLGGAVVGTMLLPGVGTAIGYMATSKKVKKGKGKSEYNVNTVVDENQVETDNTATIQVANIDTGATFSIGIKCNSKINIDLDRFDWSDVEEEDEKSIGETRQIETDSIKLLKEYKELLDMGAITQEEFTRKKRELLG